MKNFDLIIIGWGKAGKTLASQAANRGKKVAIIEQDPKMIGGTCVNVGCIPSKSLVVKAEQGKYKNLISFEDKAEYYRQSIIKTNALTNKLRDKMFHNLADNPQISIFLGKAEFVSSKEIRIINQQPEIITGQQILINTGSTPIIPDIEGVKNNPRIFTSQELLSQETLPEHLLIIGGGYIALEFASIYATFGAKVTIVQRGHLFLPKEDRDIAEEIIKVLEQKGIKIITGFMPMRITNQDEKVTLEGQNNNHELQSFSANNILLATGRQPNIQELHLEKAQINISEKKGIIVDQYLRTNIPNIWAAGDVVGGLQFTYISFDDTRIIAPQLFNQESTYSTQERLIVPFSVFIDPPFSRIGLNEQDAKKQNIIYKVAKLSSAAIPKAHVLEQTNGFMKVLINPETKQILGAALFCAESHELINTINIVMKSKLPYTIFKEAIFTHPTISEAFNDLFNL